MPILNRLLLLCAFFTTYSVIAQNGFTKPELYKITHVPPNAASLGKYGLFPVGLYTGVPNIDLPVYEINSGRIKVPIALSYHAGGIRVEEMASLVGIGWSLISGGTISRSVRGMPDEEVGLGGYNFFNDPESAAIIAIPPANPTSDEYRTWSHLVASYHMARRDGQPDQYSFNMGSVSGKFMYDQETDQFVSIPASNVRIEKDQEAFILTDADGLRYTFSLTETSTREADGQEVFVTATSWFLDQIYDPVTEKTVHFSYETYNISYPMMSGQFHYYPFGFVTDIFMSPKQNPQYSLLRLKKIEFDDGKIEFTHGLNRCDIIGDKALTNIRVFNGSNILVKNIDLHYDYFYAYGTDAQSPCNVDQSVNKRLKLLRVENKPTGVSNLPPQIHSFEYRDGLPSRFSFSQDHWGYYNGKPNSVLYPKDVVSIVGQLVTLDGANREVNPQLSGVGMLNRINFPTGGYSQFEFENNTVAGGLPPVTHDNVVTAGAGETSFSVNSASCKVNGQNQENGANVTYELNGVNMDLIGGFPGEALKVYIVNQNNTQEIYDLTLISSSKTYMNSPIYFYLPNGDYSLVVDTNPAVPPGGVSEVSVSVRWTSCESDIGGANRPAGGQRIKKISSYDATGKLAFIKSYKYVNEILSLESSGQTQYLPSYGSYTRKLGKNSVNGQLTAIEYYKRSAYSNYPMVSDNGRAVGYSTVIEIDGENGENGYTQYKYTNYLNPEGDILDILGSLDFGGIPAFQFGYLRGLEKEKTVFKKIGTQFIPAEKRITEYELSMFGQTGKKVSGFYGGFSFIGDPCEFGSYDPVGLSMEVVAGAYTFTSDFPYVKRIIEYTYANGENLEKKTDYIYNTKNLLPSRIETTNSKGEKELTTTRYPVDYAVTNAQSPKGQSIENLQFLNMISVPVEQFTEVERAGVKKLKKALYTSYLPSKPLTDTLFYLTDNLLPVSNYSGIAITSDGFSRLPAYKPEVIIDKYGPYNELQQQKKNNDLPLAYLYNRQRSQHVAMATNANNDQIAYSSFEADDNGGFSMNNAAKNSAIAITGSFSYTLNASSNISKTQIPQLPAGAHYNITYWSRNGAASVNSADATPLLTKQGWTLYEHRLPNTTSTVTISGSNITIDELRLFPSFAQMTTVTFNPLIGMTSKCDVNNKITYYEYDEFVRLLRIRDIDRNLVKQFEYRFQVPTHHNPIWVRTGITRCKPCPQNAAYNSNILQKQERDVNPGSPTYNQMRWIDDGESSTCVIVPAWEPTGLLTCDQQNGANTGLQLKQMTDMNPCSPTYNQLTYQSNGQNTTSCPIPTFYARLSLVDPGSWFSDVVVNFYLNPSRTIPYNMQSMELIIRVTAYNDFTEETTVSDVLVNYNGGTQNVVMQGALLYEPSDKGTYWYSYELLPGPGFQVL